MNTSRHAKLLLAPSSVTKDCNKMTKTQTELTSKLPPPLCIDTMMPSPWQLC